MEQPDKCPRCGGPRLEEEDAGSDGFEDDVAYTVHTCAACGLWFSGWTRKWYLPFAGGHDEEAAEEFGAGQAKEDCG